RAEPRRDAHGARCAGAPAGRGLPRAATLPARRRRDERLAAVPRAPRGALPGVCAGSARLRRQRPAGVARCRTTIHAGLAAAPAAAPCQQQRSLLAYVTDGCSAALAARTITVRRWLPLGHQRHGVDLDEA